MIGDGTVRLAPLRGDDSAKLFAWINQRALALKNAPYRPISELSHDAWFAEIQQRKGFFIFAIRLESSDALVGSCQLHSVDPVHRSAELQIRIGEETARGQGIGTRAVKLLLDFAFNDLNLRRVFVHVFADNGSAIRVYEKNGFVLEGTLREAAYIDGSYVDVVIMGRLRADVV